QRDADVATPHRVTYPVALVRIEEQHLVRIRYSLVTSKVAHEDAAVRKDQFRGRRVLFRALFPAVALAAHLSDRDGRRFQQRKRGKFRHADRSNWPSCPKPAGAHAAPSNRSP